MERFFVLSFFFSFFAVSTFKLRILDRDDSQQIISVEPISRSSTTWGGSFKPTDDGRRFLSSLLLSGLLLALPLLLRCFILSFSMDLVPTIDNPSVSPFLSVAAVKLCQAAASSRLVTTTYIPAGLSKA